MAFIKLWDLVQRPRDIHDVDPEIVARMEDETDFDTPEFRNIQEAVNQYNQDRPRKFRVLQQAAGSRASEFSLLALVPDWDDSCNITDVQVGLTNNQDRQERFLHKNDWHPTLAVDGVTPVIKFDGSIGEDFILWCQRNHLFDYPPATPGQSLGTSIPVATIGPLAHLVASITLGIAANHFAKKARLQAQSSDTVNYAGLAKDLREQSEKEKAIYNRDTTQVDNGPNGVFVTFETKPAFDNTGDWLFHSRMQGGRLWL